MAQQDEQYGRKVSLLLVEGEKALDLSEMHIKFQTSSEDQESPGNCSIRVFNLADDTVKRIQGEYNRVVLQAGYEKAGFGVIFEGTIKQYRIGASPDGIDKYLDILAADGDAAYNFAVVNSSVAAGSTSQQRAAIATKAMEVYGVLPGKNLVPQTAGILPRGKVLFGLARAALSTEATTNGATWSIQNGKVQIIPLTGYLPGEAVVLTADTGLIGRVEQTEAGVQVRCLLNPKIIVGGLIKIDNKSINKTTAGKGQEIPGAQLAYNRYAGLQMFADLSADGLYRVYVAEHVGDTRGNEFYTDLVCLAVDPVTMKVKAYG